MVRIHSMALRVGNTIDWLQDVKHVFLTNFVRNLFREKLISKPLIRSSVNQIWIDVTVLDSVFGPKSGRTQTSVLLDLDSLDVMREGVSGQIEKRLNNITTADKYYQQFFKNKCKSTFAALFKDKKINARKALNIHTDVPIVLRVNLINNPLLDSTVCSNLVAVNLNDDRKFKRIIKNIKSEAQRSVP